MDKPFSQYRTSDLYFAAYLKVAAVPLLHLEREGKQVTFVFEGQGGPAMRSLKDQYFSDRAKVPALSYAQTVRDLKRQIYETQ